MIYSLISFTASALDEGKTTDTKTNAAFNNNILGMQIQDVMLQSAVVHLWALPDFQHHSPVSGKIYSCKCVCDMMCFEINS